MNLLHAADITLSMEGRAESQYETMTLKSDGVIETTVRAVDQPNPSLPGYCEVHSCDMCHVSMDTTTLHLEAGLHTLVVEVTTRDGRYHKDAFFEIDFSVAGESPDCHSPPPPSPLQPPPLSPPPSSPASPPPAPPYSCNCWGDPHCSTFSNDGHDFYGVGLYEYARFCTSGPCGTCEVDIQTFLGRPLHSSQPNSFIVGIAVRMCGWTLEFDEDAVKVYYDATATIWGVYHLGSGHIGTLSTFPPCIGASMENSASLERVCRMTLPFRTVAHLLSTDGGCTCRTVPATSWSTW